MKLRIRRAPVRRIAFDATVTTGRDYMLVARLEKLALEKATRCFPAGTLMEIQRDYVISDAGEYTATATIRIWATIRNEAK